MLAPLFSQRRSPLASLSIFATSATTSRWRHFSTSLTRWHVPAAAATLPMVSPLACRSSSFFSSLGWRHSFHGPQARWHASASSESFLKTYIPSETSASSGQSNFASLHSASSGESNCAYKGVLPNSSRLFLAPTPVNSSEPPSSKLETSGQSPLTTL